MLISPLPVSLVSLVGMQRTLASSSLTGQSVLNPNAKRLHSNISCNDFDNMARASNGADKAIIVVNSKTYQIRPSWFATFGDDGQEFYKNNCVNNNNPSTNIQLKTGGELTLHYNIKKFQDSSIYLVNNTESDEHILTSNEQHLIVDQFKKLSTASDNASGAGLQDFTFRVDNKHKVGTFNLVIVEGVNDEAASFYIVKNVIIS
jgi:hypothetical protein